MDNTFSVYHYCFCLNTDSFYDQIRRCGSPLTLRWGTCLEKLGIYSVPWHSLSWSVHLVQWTQYCQINLSIC